MIFDLEDEGSERGIPASNHLLPLNELPHMPSRPPRTRHIGSGLPSSLSSLRPTSLPSPSATRQPHTLRTPEKTSQSIRATQSLENSPQGHTKGTPALSTNTDSENVGPPDPREEEILKLVAADTPSHRGAWKKDSKAWQLFVRRQGGKARQSGGLIPEEIEDDTLAKYTDDGSGGDSDSDVQSGNNDLS